MLFVDFREQPLLNTPRSMALLGQALGREARAAAFNAAHAEALAAVRERLPQGAAPKVFLHSRAGLGEGCCESMARGMFADLLAEAGGDNIARERLPGHAGTLSLELLLSQPPELYIASAVGSAVGAFATGCTCVGGTGGAGGAGAGGRDRVCDGGRVGTADGVRVPAAGRDAGAGDVGLWHRQ